MTTNAVLAQVGTAFAAISLACLTLGYRAVKRKQLERHRRLMIAAFATSAAFMVVFVVRFVTFGFAPFEGGTAARGIYLATLLTHEPVAVINLPLGCAALLLGLMRRVSAHREIARVALPVWMFVAASGIAIYVQLYVL